MQDSDIPIENGNCESSSTKKEDACKIFVGGLSWDTTREKLAEYFSRFGEIIDCVLMLDTQTRRSRGFGFVTYANPKAVYEVLANVPHFLDGKYIDPKAAVPKLNFPLPQKSSQCPVPSNSIPSASTVNLNYKKYNKIFVGGIGQASEEDLRTYFSTFGRVTEVSIIMDKLTGRPRGFAFVGFDDCKAAEATVSVRYHSIRNKKVEVKKALPRDIKMMENCIKDFTSFNPEDLMFSNLTLHDTMGGMEGLTSDSMSMSPQIWKPTGSMAMGSGGSCAGRHMSSSMMPGTGDGGSMSYNLNCMIPSHSPASFPNGVVERSVQMNHSDFSDSPYTGSLVYDHIADILPSDDQNPIDYMLAYEQNENRLPRSIYPNAAPFHHGYHYSSRSHVPEDASSVLPSYVHSGAGADSLIIDRSTSHECLKRSCSDKSALTASYPAQSPLHANLSFPDTKHMVRSSVESYDSIASIINSRDGSGSVDEMMINLKYKYSSKSDCVDNAVVNNCSDSNISVFSNRSFSDAGAKMEPCNGSSVTSSLDGGDVYPSNQRTPDAIATGSSHSLVSSSSSTKGDIGAIAPVGSNAKNQARMTTAASSSNENLDGEEDSEGLHLPCDLRTDIINLLNEIWK